MKLLKKFAITATIAASFMAIFSSCNNAVVESEAKAPAGVLRSDSSNGYAEDKSYQKDVMYFLFVDRFYDGDSSNNNGNSAAQYDTTHGSDLSLYQGGDLAGLNQKLDYLKDMGITSIWVTPLVDNRDVNDSMTYGSPYHGYHAHDFFNIDEHWGSWEEFDALVAKMHSNDYKMRLILDYAPNHSNQSDCGERAALYKSYYDENGNWLRREFLTDIDHDTNKEWYHQLGGISGTQWEDNYWCRYGNLYNLADLNQDNPTTYAYLADALEMWLKRGVDGVRLDAVKHMNTSFTKSLVSDMESRLEKDIYFFGEWFGAGYGATQLNVQGQEFEHTTGCSLLDFLYRDSMQAALLGGSVRSLADYLSNRETYWAEPLRTVVFLDNHDMARINTTLRNAGMNESKAAAKTNVGLAVTMTVRGVPCIYYGTEHYDARFESGGTDPYNRQNMTSFNENTDAFNIIKKLSALKQTNLALQDGNYAERWQDETLLSFQRIGSNGDVVVVFANFADWDRTESIGNLALPNGTYQDVISGRSFSVTNGTFNGTVYSNSTVVLAYSEPVPETPVIESVTPASGYYTTKQTVTITTNSDSNTIYYTLDGTTPTAASNVYTGAFTLSENATLNVIAYNANANNSWSSVVTREYEIDPIETDLTVHVYKNDITNWSTFYCYFWASDGDSASNKWPGSIMTQESEHWYSYAIAGASEANVIFNNNSVQTVDLSRSADGWFVPTGWSNGKVTGTWYNYNPYPDTISDPVVSISLASGTYTSAQTVTISSTNSSDVIYFTLDGTTPTAASTVYTSALTISASTTLKAISFNSAADNQWSTVETREYTIEPVTSNGNLTINFIAGSNSENVSIPGDFNGWNLNSTTASVSAYGSKTFVLENVVTSSNIALGNSTSKLELKLVTNASWNNQWSFGSWTKSSNISLSDSNRQIAIDVEAGKDVELTINVATLTLTAEVQ